MSNWISRSFCCLGAVLALAWLGGSLSPLIAGEPILFTPAKSKLEPSTLNNKLPKEKVSALDRIPVASPMDGVDPASLAKPSENDPRRPKTKEQKLRKLAELEKKNWATVGPGELQEEEQEKTSMGVREYDVETSGREKNASDILFDRKTGDKSRSQGNPRSRSTASRAPGQNRPTPARESDDEGLKIGKGAGQVGASASAPNSEDGRLDKLLAPDAVSGPKDDFGGVNSSMDQGRRGDSGVRTIEKPAGTRPATLGGEALGFGKETSARSSLSGSSLPFDAPRSQPSSPFASPGGSPGFGSSRNREVPSFFDPPSASRDRFGNSASPLTPQQNQFAPGSSRDAFAPPTRPSSGR